MLSGSVVTTWFSGGAVSCAATYAFGAFSMSLPGAVAVRLPLQAYGSGVTLVAACLLHADTVCSKHCSLHAEPVTYLEGRLSRKPGIAPLCY